MEKERKKVENSKIPEGLLTTGLRITKRNNLCHNWKKRKLQ